MGSATIVMVIAIGEGGKQDVAEQYKTLNAGTITVSSGSAMMDMGMMGGGGMSGGGMSGGGSVGGGALISSAMGGGGSSSRGGSSTMMLQMEDNKLSQEDLEDIFFFVPDIVTGAITATTDSEVIGGDMEEAVSFTIVGTEESYQEISNLTPAIGSFITDEDNENMTRCVVLGYNVAAEIFGSLQGAYDSMVEIDGRSYVVNGVLSQVGTVVSGINPDDSVFMPYTTADKYLLDASTSPQFSILATDVDAVPTVMENVELVLNQSNPDATYSVTDAGATMDAAMQSANTLSMLLLAVAVLVFVVGGIGIMNVLFVSVKERTREIGVLKAIGTKKLDILMLFLTEAAMIGFIGGVFGVILGYAVMPLMEYLDMTVVMTSGSVVLAFAFAVVTGTLFGFYPAFKASNLVPIKALNNE